MDEEERTFTRIILSLLEKAVITFAGAAAGGIALGPAGIPIGSVAATGLSLVRRDGLSSWGELRSARGWKELILLTLKVAADLAIENWALLYNLAIRIARLLENLFNSQHSTPISY